MDAMKRGLQQMESGMVPEAAAMDAAVVLETAVDGCHNEGWSCIRWKLQCFLADNGRRNASGARYLRSAAQVLLST